MSGCFAGTELFFERPGEACKKPVKESSVGFGRPPLHASAHEQPSATHQPSSATTKKEPPLRESPPYHSYTKFSVVAARSLSVGAFWSFSDRIVGWIGHATPMSGSSQRMLPSHSGA